MPQFASRQSTPQRHAPMVILALIFLISLVIEIGRGFGEGTLILVGVFLVTFVPLIVERLARVAIPLHLQVLYGLLLLSGGYIGSYLHFYGVWYPWDTVVHFYSGFVIALAAHFALRVIMERYKFTLPGWVHGVILTAIGVTGAFLWEVGEFVRDLLVGGDAQVDNQDTMTDMIAGTIAALIVAVLVSRRSSQRMVHKEELAHNSR